MLTARVVARVEELLRITELLRMAQIVALRPAVSVRTGLSRANFALVVVRFRILPVRIRLPERDMAIFGDFVFDCPIIDVRNIS